MKNKKLLIFIFIFFICEFQKFTIINFKYQPAYIDDLIKADLNMKTLQKRKLKFKENQVNENVFAFFSKFYYFFKFFFAFKEKKEKSTKAI